MWRRTVASGVSWQMIKDSCYVYSQHSTIHGVKYIGERKRSCCEKIWWLTAFCASIFFCGKLIFDAWNIDPIIISPAAKPIPIWQIPFPAVIICPKIIFQPKLNDLNLTDIMNRLWKQEKLSDFLSKKQIMQVVALSNVCPAITVTGDIEKYQDCNKCVNILRDMRIPPEEMFVDCKFKNEMILCRNVLEEIDLNNIFCYTFNNLEIYHQSEGRKYNEWSIDDGYKPKATLEIYPRRALEAGIKFGFSMLMKLNIQDLNYDCYGIPGFWIMLRMPQDNPQISKNFYAVSMEESVTIAVKPQMIQLSDELRDYSASERKCYMSNEFGLTHYKQYTRNNCEISCRADLVIEKCGCVPLFWSNVSNVDKCGPKQHHCVRYYEHELFKNYFIPCNCLPACTSISYESEVTVTKLNISADRTRFRYSRVTIYLKENQVLPTLHKELYGKTDFLANCGGILGLGLGLSVMSLLEIFYFCTIRLCCNCRKNITTKLNIIVEELSYFRFKSTKTKSTIRNAVNDYATNTTIQGIDYVADYSLSLLERFWWGFVIVMSVFCCGSLISNTIHRYNQSPLIISYANEETQISEIPFPAVTICPMIVSPLIPIMYDDFKVKNKSLYDIPEESMEYVTAVAVVCDPELFGDIDPENRTHCDSCSEILSFFINDFDNMFTHCVHHFSGEPCSHLFKKVMTEEGACFTFNGLDVYRNMDNDDVPFEEWTLEDGYKNKSKGGDIFPHAGSKLRLKVTMNTHKIYNNGFCKGSVQGIRAYLHLPNEVPQTSKHYFLLPYLHSVFLSLNPNVITTAPELRDFPIEKRQCYYSDERYLRFFKHYTKNNCEIECAANLTLSKCGCLRFHMPRLPGVKVCGISDIMCYHMFRDQSFEKNTNQNQISDCNCLPTCTSISFDAEISKPSMSYEALAARGFFSEDLK